MEPRRPRRGLSVNPTGSSLVQLEILSLPKRLKLQPTIDVGSHSKSEISDLGRCFARARGLCLLLKPQRPRCAAGAHPRRDGL